MSGPGILRKVDAVTVRVPDIDAGIHFYVDVLSHRMTWRNDTTGQAGLELPDGDSEIVLTTEHTYEPNWLVDSVDDAIEVFRSNGGQVIADPFDIPVGRLGVVLDPSGNALVPAGLEQGQVHHRRDRRRHRSQLIPRTEGRPDRESAVLGLGRYRAPSQSMRS